MRGITHTLSAPRLPPLWGRLAVYFLGDSFAPPCPLGGAHCCGPSVRTRSAPAMRLYMASTSLIAVSKCVVASNESERKTLSSPPGPAGDIVSYMSKKMRLAPE